MNSITALLTAIAISIALIADLTLLPALLIALDKESWQEPVSQDTLDISSLDQTNKLST